ncbi:amidase [Thalassotalea insulae]|uniref:Amidase n=1 Tax=Thalassotalea insulae TaxID=2056778 RepID=A0ABQ6GX13_9GAMM|nr:amidase [Thalassotalea insulae]GLX79265.1 amidase [Thalassotalea insulae]
MRIKYFAFLLLIIPTFFSLGQVNEQATITELHQKMKAGELTSEALVKYYLTRIEKYDRNGKKLNSVSQINKQALAQAKALDQKLKASGLVGPLHGIPVVLKDNIDTTDGMSNTAGSYALAKNFPQDDAFVVQQLKKAGAIILGKTNLSEWANFRSTASSSGWSALYGQTKNPYDTSTSPCGSSSGSGVAIAANLATIALGTETDGSVTCPSALNGIVGIKPTLGTVSRDGIIPIAHSQDTAGPMARNVTDAVILLSAMVAEDETDPNVTHSNIDYLSHLKIDGLKGKRIGIARDLMGYHQGLDKVFEQNLEILKAQGAVIIDNLTFESMSQWDEAEFTVLLYEFKHDLAQYLSQTAPGLPKTLADVMSFNEKHAEQEMPYFQQEIMEMAQAKGELTDKEYTEALAQAKTLTQAQGIDKLLKEHQLDMIIAPTTGPAWKIDLVNGDHYLGAASSAAAISGYPHITVPMGYVHGLPVGLSFFSGKLKEDVLIEAAYSFEQATLYRKPPKLD